MPAKQLQITTKPKKIVFDDDGEECIAPQKKDKQQKKAKNSKPQSGQKQQEQQQKQQHVATTNGSTNPPDPKTKKKLQLDVNGIPKKPQKIKFDDDGEEAIIVETDSKENGNSNKENDGDDDDDNGDYFAKREQKRLKKKQEKADDLDNDDGQQKWYYVFKQYPCADEILDMKENEQMELYNLCKNAFESEKSNFNKRNPTDARWLHTALHKGTAKDRANAGALLVTSNPLGNLEALSTLIGFCKISNKASSDVIGVMTDLWKEVLLPPQRKLYSLQMRGADWKHLRKNTTISNDKQKRIYAYWYFENELKENYFEFLKNLMQGLQTGQDNNKTSAIVAASHLLAYAPEKEQMLLTMLINKLGDPVAKVASKALHHLTDVAHRHPNMCGVIVSDAEKLLFRNNISERAQHFALCFLSSIAPAGRPDVCTKLVNICFALFKVLVQKGAVNNRTMQAILRCLQKAIVEAKPSAGSSEILTKEMQDTIYRLVHLADIRVGVQTLGLLLQLVTVKTEKSDRFYNALYIKMLDMNLINIGSKTAAHLLHIVHRAIHIDTNVPRALAFVKRLLQLALYTPPQVSAGCLIVLHKLLRTRRAFVGLSEEANGEDNQVQNVTIKVDVNDAELAKFDSDGEEKYEDITEEGTTTTTVVEKSEETEKASEKPTPTPLGSWHHAKVAASEGIKDYGTKVRNINATKYDAYHRVPAFAGAEYALRNELHLLRQHYHPTVQVFAEHILNDKRIDYYGDPLRDFSLPHFLERFAFKNPKKLETDKAESAAIAHKRYVSHGARGRSVKSLTKSNCTEDEMFIFNYLEHKRKQASLIEKSKKAEEKKKAEAEGDDAGDADTLLEGEVDDNEFESYLDGYFGKKSLKAAENLDFLQELGGELHVDKDKKNKKKQAKTNNDDDDGDMSDIDADWGDDDVQGGEDDDEGGSDSSDDEAGSIDLDGGNDVDDDDDDDDGSISLDEPMDEDEDDNDEEDDDDNISGSEPESDADEDDEELAPPKSKKSRKHAEVGMNDRGFSKKLKQSTDMSSLFAAADDFSELLEETAKTKGQGTINAVFNKDKSSDKQLKWEEKRRSNTKNYTKGKKSFGKSDVANASKGGKIGKGKKRKH